MAYRITSLIYDFMSPSIISANVSHPKSNKLRPILKHIACTGVIVKYDR